MKKIITFLISVIFVLGLTGCGKITKKDVINKTNKKIEKTNGYLVKAEMELINNEDKYKYDVIVSYKKDDYFRVSLLNKNNNHEQIILRNKDGVYVLSPSLNKSFKFQSKWPYNNSQSYLMQSVINSIKNDSKATMKNTKDGYVIKSTVDFKNNKQLKYQEVYINKNYIIKKVVVYDTDNNPKICVKYNEVDMKAKFDNNYFSLKENMETSKIKDEKPTNYKETVYPMYLPEGTYLKNEKTVDLDKGSRVILTFAGNDEFMLVEEPAIASSSLSVIPSSGDIDMIADSIAIIDSTSISWVSGGTEYYLVSNDLSKSEMISVAQSISSMPISK